MRKKFGFIVVTHQFPNQAIRLFRTLKSTFEGCQIVWHHDRTKCVIDLPNDLQDVQEVKTSLRTWHGGFEVSQATIKCLDVIMKTNDPPDWIYLLSGADYPIQNESSISSFLEKSEAEAFGSFSKLYPLDGIDWFKWNCHNRVRHFRLPIPFFSSDRKLHFRNTEIPFLKNFRLNELKNLGIELYVGSHWWTVSKIAANIILNFFSRKEGLLFLNVMSFIPFVDEILFPTIFGNLKDISIVNNNLRYIDWFSPEVRHPAILNVLDLEAVFMSKAHFARKFSPDNEQVLDQIDAYRLNPVALNERKLNLYNLGRHTEGPSNSYRIARRME